MVAVGDGVLYIVDTTYHGDGHSNGAIIHVHSLTGEHLRVIRGDWCISSLYIDERRLYLYSRARVRHRHLNLGWALPCDWCIIVLSPEGVLLQTFKMHKINPDAVVPFGDSLLLDFQSDLHLVPGA